MKVPPLAAVVVLLGALVGSAHGDVAAGRPVRWKTVTSPHFVVRTDADARVYQPVLERLEDVHEALRTTLFEGLPLTPVQVLLLARPRDFQALAPAGLVGFYTTSLPGFEDTFREGLLVFSAGGDQGLVAATAAHELAHHFMQALSDRVPTWLHEGFAKYVGALQLRGRRITFDATPVNDTWLRAAPPVPLARLLGADTTDFHGASARAQYLTAWLLVRELLSPGTRAAVPVAAHFQELVARSVLARTPAAQAAMLSDLLGGITLPALEARVRKAHEALRAGGATPSMPFSVMLSRADRPAFSEGPADAVRIAALRALLADQARAPMPSRP